VIGLSVRVSSGWAVEKMQVMIKVRREAPYDVEVGWEPKEAFDENAEKNLKEIAKRLYVVHEGRFCLDTESIWWASLCLSARCKVFGEGDFVKIVFSPLEGFEQWFAEEVKQGAISRLFLCQKYLYVVPEWISSG